VWIDKLRYISIHKLAKNFVLFLLISMASTNCCKLTVGCFYKPNCRCLSLLLLFSFKRFKYNFQYNCLEYFGQKFLSFMAKQWFYMNYSCNRKIDQNIKLSWIIEISWEFLKLTNKIKISFSRNYHKLVSKILTIFIFTMIFKKKRKLQKTASSLNFAYRWVYRINGSMIYSI
jgi:hypothetical protein